MKEILIELPALKQVKNLKTSVHEISAATQNTLMSANPFFQPRLSINQAKDLYEADAVADKVMRKPSNEPHFPAALKSTDNHFFVQRIPIQNGLAANSIQNNLTAPISTTYLPEGAITRTQFDFFVKQRYGVQEVKDGLQPDQESEIAPRGVTSVAITNWQAWNPGSTSEDYTHIIEAVEDVRNTMGGIPAISRIVFYDKQYEVQNGVVVPRPDTGASFGAGVLTVYRSYSSARGFPVARSTAGGSYNVVAAISSPGSAAGAPVPLTSHADYIRQNIAHELGHGIGEEAANHINPAVFTDFNREVGWVSGRLFDIGEPTVAAAIAAGNAPPSQFEITADHWNDPNWHEQPMSNYSVAGGGGEDFAESISAYIYANSVLQSRSPHRYQFIQTRISSWQSALHIIAPLLQRPPLGDYPEPSRTEIPV